MLALPIALAGFVFYVLTQSREHYTKVQKLPNGATLWLVGVEMTNGFHTFQSKAVTGWRKTLSEHLPRALTSKFGWLPMSGGMTIGTGGKGNSLGLFTSYEGPMTNSEFTFTRLKVFDEQGNTFDAGTAMGTMASFNGKDSIRLDGWLPPAFPRRGKTLGLHYFERKGNEWVRVADFLIPNPAPGNYPTWTAESLPITKTNDDLIVTLESLKAGMSAADKSKPAASNEIALTEAKFRLVQSGHATNAWRPISVEISDATGNDWLPFPHISKVRHEGDADIFSFQGALWPGEAAWKMKFEFSRVSDFDPDEVFTFSGITVPGATQVITLDNATNVGGCKLQLKAISGEKAEQPGNLKWVTVKQRVNISIAVNPVLADRRLALLQVTDENGHEGDITREPDWNSGERVYGFKVPEGAKQLSLKFALHKSRIVEFQARPEFVRTN